MWTPPAFQEGGASENFLLEKLGLLGTGRPAGGRRVTCLLPGEKPYLCDKCGRGFNRVDNLRSHVKTVHQGKAGIKILEPEEGGEVSVVTVDDMVTLATEALAATAVTQLTGVHCGQGGRGQQLQSRLPQWQQWGRFLWLLPQVLLTLPTVLPVGAAVTADETEVLKAEISKAVKQVQEEGERGSLGHERQWTQGPPHPDHSPHLHRPQHPHPLRL